MVVIVHGYMHQRRVLCCCWGYGLMGIVFTLVQKIASKCFHPSSNCLLSAPFEYSAWPAGPPSPSQRGQPSPRLPRHRHLTWQQPIIGRPSSPHQFASIARLPLPHLVRRARRLSDTCRPRRAHAGPSARWHARPANTYPRPSCCIPALNRSSPAPARPTHSCA